jgi:signal transduction histidine kinase
MNKHKAVTRTLDSGDPHNIQVALLVAAREEERKKIARELHDSVGQEMAALALEINSVLDSCRKLGVRRDLREVCETLHHSYTRISYLTTCVGRISHQLHPAILEQAGLAAALEGLCAETRALTGIEVYCGCTDLPDRILSDSALCFYRIAQEALHNIGKHAKASSIALILSGSSDAIKLQVRDNGCGFEPSKPETHTGVGLRSMQERASSLGGEFSLKTELGKGTEITVRIPQEADNASKDTFSRRSSPVYRGAGKIVDSQL